MKKKYMKKLHRTIALALTLAGSVQGLTYAEGEDALPVLAENGVFSGVEKIEDPVTNDAGRTVMTIEQQADAHRALIEWESFNIGSNADVNILQHTSSDLLVNAVSGGHMSEIAGHLNATGNIMLVNPNGVMFADGAQVNVGGLSVYASNFNPSTLMPTTDGENQGNIIVGAANINVGISAALANLNLLGDDEADYAVAVEGLNGYSNQLRLVANGNIEIRDGAVLNALDYTSVTNSGKQMGEEGFKKEDTTSHTEGRITVRADNNADDYGSVTITHGDGAKPQLNSRRTSEIFYNPVQKGTDAATTTDVNGGTTYYTKKDYKNGYLDFTGSDDSNVAKGNAQGKNVSVDAEGNRNITDGLKAAKINGYMLVNNIAQLQDIGAEDVRNEKDGHIIGNYVLGRDIYAQNDKASFVDNGIFYKNTDANNMQGTGNLVKISLTDNGTFDAEGNVKTLTDDTRIVYDREGDKSVSVDKTGVEGAGYTLTKNEETLSVQKDGATADISSAGSTVTSAGTTYAVNGSTVSTESASYNGADSTYTKGTDSYTVDVGGSQVTKGDYTADTLTGTVSNGTTTVNVDAKTVTKGTEPSATVNSADSVTIGSKTVDTTANKVTEGDIEATVSDKAVTIGENTRVDTGATENNVKIGELTATVQDTSVSIGDTKVYTEAGTVQLADATVITRGADTKTVETTGDGAYTADMNGSITVSDGAALTNISTDANNITTAAMMLGAENYAVIRTGDSVTVTQTVMQTIEDVPTEVTTEITDENIIAEAKTALTYFDAATGIYNDSETVFKQAQAAATAMTQAKSAVAALAQANEAVTVYSSAAAYLTEAEGIMTEASAAKTGLDTYNTLSGYVAEGTKGADLVASMDIARTEFQNELITKSTTTNIDSSKWDAGKGFKPIGDDTVKFSGLLSGNDGNTDHDIVGLTIDRPTEDNVGLIGVLEKYDNDNTGLVSAIEFRNGAAVAASDKTAAVPEAKTTVVGESNVGIVAGKALDGTKIQWVNTWGTVRTGAQEAAAKDITVPQSSDTMNAVNIGGIAGYAGKGTNIYSVVNLATVIGRTFDGTDITNTADADGVVDVANTGGVVGISEGAKFSNTRNEGRVYGELNVGGIAGSALEGTTLDGTYLDTHNRLRNTAPVEGDTNVGGIVGYGKGVELQYVYNSNEPNPLDASSQYIISSDGTIQYQKTNQNGTNTTNAGKNIAAEEVRSSYGKITGVTNVGGLVGLMENGTDKNSSIDTAYNAGNINGTTNVGGLVGKMTGGTITNAYNGDNNTVVREQLTIPDAVKTETGIKDPFDAEKTYKYNTAKVGKLDNGQYDAADQDATMYYSFYTLDEHNNRTYYYFLPVDGQTKKGAGGVYVNKDGQIVTSNGTYRTAGDTTIDTSERLPATNERHYLNRIASKDARVAGEENVGGLVGRMETGTASIRTAYNEGTVTGTTNAGGLVGSLQEGITTEDGVQDAFYMTGTDKTTGLTYSNPSGVTDMTAIGGRENPTAAGTTVRVLEAQQGKEKFYVAGSNENTGFPVMAQARKEETKGFIEYVAAGGTKYYVDNSAEDLITKVYTSDNKEWLTKDKDSNTFKDKDNKTYTLSYDTVSQQLTIQPAEGEAVSLKGLYQYATGDATYYADGNTAATITTITKKVVGEETPDTFIKKEDGKFYFQDNPFTMTFNASNKQITLTADNTGITTSAITFNAILKKTGGSSWVVYEDQTAPLLAPFMQDISAKRTFTYDGSTHNLKTDDVADLYGRADFNGDAGKAVQLSNFALSDNGVSSAYTFDNTSIWSPQHGYIIDADSTLIIEQVDMTAKITASRTYGDLYDTSNYYVCVSYKDSSNNDLYAFYDFEDNGEYKLLTGEALQKFFAPVVPEAKKDLEYTKADLQALGDKNGVYVLELSGFVNGEGAQGLDGVITGLLATLKKGNEAEGSKLIPDTTSSGHSLSNLFSDKKDGDKKLDAGVYKVSNGVLSGLNSLNQNYKINYDGELTIKQAELWYTYAGEREYGVANSDASAVHNYSLVGVDEKPENAGDKEVSVHGYLKSWDADNEAYKNFFKDGYLLNTENLSVVGYEATTRTTTTTRTDDDTDVKTDTKEVKNEEANASLDQIYDNLHGTITGTTGVNIEKLSGDVSDEGAPGVLIAKADTVTDADGNTVQAYSHVLADENQSIVGYRVTTFQDTNEKAEGTIQVKEKTAAEKDAVATFNNNYKLVWKEGGSYDREWSALNTAEDEERRGTDTVNRITVADSTFTIKPKELTVEVTGIRDYGTVMDTSQYATTTDMSRVVAGSGDTKTTVHVGDVIQTTAEDGTISLAYRAPKDETEITPAPEGATQAVDSLTKGVYNLNLNGLVNGDNADVLNGDAVKALLGTVELAHDANPTEEEKSKKLNKFDNVKQKAGDGSLELVTDSVYNDATVYAYDITKASGDTAEKENSRITVTDKTTDHYKLLNSNNYDYKLVDGTHTLTIDRHDLQLTFDVKSAPSRVYGDATNSETTLSTFTYTLETTANGLNLENGELANGESVDGEKSKVYINLPRTANAGTYTHSWIDSETEGGYSFAAAKDGAIADTVGDGMGITGIDLKLKNNYGELDPSNYNITYTTKYTVTPAPLYYTYDGEREYGEASNTATKGNGAENFKLVGVDAEGSSVQGYLKAWDAENHEYTEENSAGSFVLARDRDAVIGANIITNYASLTNPTDIFDTMKGRGIEAGNITGDNQALTKAGGNVLVDNTTGKVTAYDITSWEKSGQINFASGDATKDLMNNYVLTWAPGGTELTKKQNITTEDGKITAITQDETYNETVKQSTYQIDPVKLVVKVEGIRQYGDRIAANHDTGGKVLPSAGPRPAGYIFSANGSYNVPGQLKNGAGFGTVFDTKELQDDDSTPGLLGSIDDRFATAPSETQFNSYTDVGVYSLRTGKLVSGDDPYTRNTLTLSSGYENGAFTVSDGKAQQSAALKQDVAATKFNYYLVDGEHTLTIQKAKAVIDLKGAGTYGSAPSTDQADYDHTGSSMTLGDYTQKKSEELRQQRKAAAEAQAAQELSDLNWSALTFDTTADNYIKNSITNTTDVGVYTKGSPTGANYPLTLSDGFDYSILDNGTFKASNYNLSFTSTYTVNKAPLTIHISGEKTYGDVTSTAGSAYEIKAEAADGLQNGETISAASFDAATVTHNVSQYADAKTYQLEPGDTDKIGIMGIEDVTKLSGTNFKSSNYSISYQTDYKISPREITVTIDGSRTYGDANPTSGAGYDYTFADKNGQISTTKDGGTLQLLNGQLVNRDAVAVVNNTESTTKAGKYTNEAPLSEEPDTPLYAVAADGWSFAAAGGSGETQYKAANYTFTLADASSYVINKAPLTIRLTGRKDYGAVTPTSGADYIESVFAESTGFKNDEGIDLANSTVVNTVEKNANKGNYYLNFEGQTDTSMGIQGFAEDTGEKKGIVGTNGFDRNNYDIRYVTEFTVGRRMLNLWATGTKTYGDTSFTYGEVVDKDNVLAEYGDEARLADFQGLFGITALEDYLNASKDVGTYTESFAVQENDRGLTVREKGDGTIFDYSSAIKAIDKQFSNYDISFHNTAIINPKPLTVTITGSRPYGDASSAVGSDYTITADGLVGDESINGSTAKVLNNTDAFQDAGVYNYRMGGTGISGLDTAALTGTKGFKTSNYNISYASEYTIRPRVVDVYLESSRMTGDPYSERVDEPLTFGNVPQRHWDYFVQHASLRDASPLGLTPGYYDENGDGYLKLSLTGDLFRNYVLQRHTLYHILTEEEGAKTPPIMQPAIYDMMQPRPQPILDVMYLEVDREAPQALVEAEADAGSAVGGRMDIRRPDGELLQVAAGTPEAPSYQEAVRVMHNGEESRRSFREFDGGAFGMQAGEPAAEILRETDKAIPVLYTDGFEKELYGVYTMQYGGSQVTLIPSDKKTELPEPAEIRKDDVDSFSITYRSEGGVYEVAYGNGLVSLYPQNSVALSMLQDEDKRHGREVLTTGILSAIRDMGVLPDAIRAVYVYTVQQ